VLNGTTVSNVRLPVHAPSPTASMVQRASTCLPMNFAASAPIHTSVTRASSSTPAGHRHALTVAGVPSSRATATLAAVDQAIVGLIAASTTRVPALRASTAAAVPPSLTPPSGQ